MTDFGIFPPVNILGSASRLSKELTREDHQNMMHKFRRLYALLKENEMLIRIGAYHQGNDPELDEAIEKKEKMEKFLIQLGSEKHNFQQIVAALKGSLS